MMAMIFLSSMYAGQQIALMLIALILAVTGI